MRTMSVVLWFLGLAMVGSLVEEVDDLGDYFLGFGDDCGWG